MTRPHTRTNKEQFRETLTPGINPNTQQVLYYPPEVQLTRAARALTGVKKELIKHTNDLAEANEKRQVVRALVYPYEYSTDRQKLLLCWSHAHRRSSTKTTLPLHEALYT